MSSTRRQLLLSSGSSAVSQKSVSNAGKRIGILIVAYNAVGTLANVLRRIPPEVWENVEEVAVFDDASGDATYELAVGYKTVGGLDKVHTTKNVRNLGYGGNQKLGYAYFMKKGFDVVVLLHGDGQYAPEILHHLYAPIVAGEADAVLGSRMMPDYRGPLRGGMPLYKYIGNRILSSYENRALRLNLSEFHSGYRAYNLHALGKIDTSAMTDDFHFDTEIIIKLHHQGFRIAEVPIPTYYGNEICYVNGLKYAYDVVRAVRRYRSTVRSAKKFPEFSEYFVNYALKEDPHSSHGVARRFVGTGQDVLDLGSGDGYFSAALARDGNRVFGVDLIPAPRCRDAFAGYACADLSDGLTSAAGKLARKRYDKVLMLDLLQQLADPKALLKESADFLTPQGKAIVSVPNVANVTVRIALLFGTFRYSDRGILDRRHLRFFTRSTARAMLTDCGFAIEEEVATIVPLEFVLDLSAKNAFMRAVYSALAFVTRVFPRLFGYQWIFVARPDRTSPT